MLALVLVLLIVWMVLAIIGFAVEGLFWLFVVACILFVLTVLAGVFLRGRSARRRPR